MAPLVTPAASTMSWTDVLSKPWRANRRVATLSNRSLTGVLLPGRPTDSLDLTAICHAPLVSGPGSYRPVGLKLGKLTLPGQLALLSLQGGGPQTAAGTLIHLLSG